MSDLVGTVAALRRYPVKSMLGEALETSEVSERGLEGDRTHALLDVETGKVASAKSPRLWRELLQFRAACKADGIRIGLPDGREILADDGNADGLLSAALGRTVTLTAAREAGATLDRADPDQVIARGFDAPVDAPPLEIAQAAPLGGFFDFAPVQVLTGGSLRRIAEEAPRESITLERYRPNIFIELDGAPPFIENEWRGRTLAIGPELRLHFVAPTPRCAVPMLPHGGLGAATCAVSAVARLNRVEMPELGPGLFPCLGAFAVVAAPGTARVGQEVRFEA